jgi:hypothetical protein
MRALGYVVPRHMRGSKRGMVLVRWWVALLIFGSALSASVPPSRAQDSNNYAKGYSDGYAGRVPPSGSPSTSSAYSRGFQAGQDDVADDDETDRRNLESLGAPMKRPQDSMPVIGSDDE